MKIRIRIAAGARATETAMLEELLQLIASGAGELDRLTLPVRVVVPSISLRRHLAAALVGRCGRAVVGVSITTLWGAALEILARAGHAPISGSGLLELAVRRLAREEPVLAGALDDLDDGYAAVAGTVRDLLDAGFEPEHAEALEDFLDSDGRRLATSAEIERARTLARVALMAEEQLIAWGRPHRSALLRAARDILETHGAALWPTRALLVHGFSDATGVATDLIESLLRTFAGSLWLDHPPLPYLAEAEIRRETAFPARFLGRIGQLAGPEREIAASDPPEITAFCATELDPELRGVALRVRGLLEAGAAPEAIGVVARDLAPFTLALRRQLGALGIPFSGLGASGPAAAETRPLTALLELVERGAALPLERWLDLLHRGLGADAAEEPLAPGERTDLRLAFFAAGASRLGDARRVELPTSDWIILPLRQGIDTEAGEEGEGGRERASRRRLRAALLAGAIAAAGAVAERLERWRGERLPARGHAAVLRELAGTHLGWPASLPARARLETALAALVREAPAELPLGFDELTLLLRRGLEPEALAEPLGGHGGGVQVLSVTEARARSFEHLFLIGLSRDVFPRPVQEDALLTDRLRLPLRQLLPDLPVKADGFDEERYLFAQLLSAAPRIWLSWHQRGSDGKPRLPSPLIEPWSRDPAPAKPLESAGDLRRPLAEILCQTALGAGRGPLAALLPLALEKPIAAARLAVLDELDPPLFETETPRRRALGPYFGLIGALREAAPAQELWITTLENLAACPWQTFLRRRLHLEPLLDPLKALPELRGLLAGNVVHRVLETIAGAHAGWPEPAELEQILARSAVAVLREEGLGLRGLARAAAELARPFLEIARQVDWPGDTAPSVVGVETTGRLEVRDGRGTLHRIGFRADRADASPAGTPDLGARLTDYKTGSPISKHKTEAARRRALLRAVATGERLQTAAYVAGGSSEGRYLFLRPDLPEEARVAAITTDDPELLAVFETAVAALLDLWREGAFFPRLVEPDRDAEPPRCDFCEVAEACSRRDSGARGRLRRWAEEHDPAATAQPVIAESASAAALLGVWWLRRKLAQETAS